MASLQGSRYVPTAGQPVNTDHADIHALVRAFGLALIDRKGAAHRTLILAGGKEVPEGKLAGVLCGIAGQIDADSVAKPPVPSGPVVFAGEHLSDAYPGYMNGGAQTGRLAAQSLIAGRAHARRLS